MKKYVCALLFLTLCWGGRLYSADSGTAVSGSTGQTTTTESKINAKPARIKKPAKVKKPLTRRAKAEKKETNKSVAKDTRETPYVNTLKKWDIGILGTNYSPSGIYWNNTEVGTTGHPFASLAGGNTFYKGLLGYTFYNGWRFELDAGKWREKGSKTIWDNNIGVAGRYLFGQEIPNYDAFGVDHVDLNYYIRPIELSISYIRNHASRRLQSFTGIGIGSYKNDIHYYYRTAADTLISIHKKQSVPVYIIQAGIDYFLARDLSLRFKAKYLWGGLDVFLGPQDFIINESITGTVLTADEKQEIVDRFNDAEERSTLDGFQVELGFIYFFDFFSTR